MDFSRVLCVDGDASFLLALKRGLERHGFDVITAAHGVDALIRYESHSGDFAALVIDHDMPVMNGLDLTRSVRAMGFEGRIIIMAGNLTSGDLRACQEYKISGFFTKPFDADLLATMFGRG